MAYAKLAQLDPQFGLYSSFVGVMLYWCASDLILSAFIQFCPGDLTFHSQLTPTPSPRPVPQPVHAHRFFATSKDITIGPVAVMSLLVGDIVDQAAEKAPEYAGHVVASALAVIVGAIVFGIGILRLGFIVDFIPLPAIAAFMTGSAINIAVGQFPTMMGITGFSTRESTYKVFINILKHLGRSNLNAAMGVPALFALYAIRAFCNQMARRKPHQQKMWFFISTLRTAFIILLFTMVSWLVNKDHRSKPRFSILKDVPRGFQNMAVPTVHSDIISSFAGNIPVACIVLLIEHIASESIGAAPSCTRQTVSSPLTKLPHSLQVFRSCQQLHHQSQPGAHCYWRHQHVSVYGSASTFTMGLTEPR